MIHRIALVAAILAAPLTAQGPPAAVAPSSAPSAGTPVEQLVKVALDTSAGRIVLALDKARAPITTTNFLAYVDGGKFNGEKFYRAMSYDKGGLIQGGITSDARKQRPPIAHEPTSQTGIKHVAGTISMANAGPGTARSDFFILTTDIPAFDATATDPGFAAFGHVVEGMDVVAKIFAEPLSPTKGLGAMKGQMLEVPVRIVKASRVKE